MDYRLGSVILTPTCSHQGSLQSWINVLGFVSLILSLISPNSSWQGSCQAISGNKNSLHTSLLIFPLLCLLWKCFSFSLLKKQHCNYWKLALLHSPIPLPPPCESAPRTGGPGWCSWDGEKGQNTSPYSVLQLLILRWLLGVWLSCISLDEHHSCS